MDLKICGGAYSLGAPIAIQDCINLYPEVEFNNRVILRRFPGLLAFCLSLGGPLRGLKEMNGTAYAVAGDILYSVSSGGVAAAIGTINGAARVSMATDCTNLVIVNGTTTGYIYNGTTLSTLTDPDFLEADQVYYLDTYFIFHKTGTNIFFFCDAGAPTAFTATNIASKEGQPDKIVTMIVANRDLILLGGRTMETWRNTGEVDLAFTRMEGTFQERGAIGLHCPVLLDNSIYYLGNDRVVYTLVGYRPVRVSTHAIEKWLAEQTSSVLDGAIGMAVTFEGHYWYILSFATGTWVYDSTVSHMTEIAEWFQLQSWDVNNWRITHVETVYGKTLCGDAAGNLYELSRDTLTENGTRTLKQRTTPFYQDEKQRLTCNRLQLDFKEGVANTSVTDPSINLQISKDGGRTWGSRRTRSMGKLGEYLQKAIWRRNGPARNFVFRWFVTDDVEVTITGGYGEFGGVQS